MNTVTLNMEQNFPANHERKHLLQGVNNTSPPVKKDHHLNHVFCSVSESDTLPGYFQQTSGILYKGVNKLMRTINPFSGAVTLGGYKFL